MLIQIIIIQIVVFGLLIFLLRVLFKQHLNMASTSINTLLEENMVKEAQLTEELKRIKEEKEAEIKRGKVESLAIIEEAKSEGLKLRLKMEEEAKQQVEKILLDSKEEAAKFKENAIKEIFDRSMCLAVEIIERIFTEENKEGLQAKFTNEIIEEIAKLPRDKLPVSVNKVRVVSGFPLKESQREDLRKALCNKLGEGLNFEEIVDKDLISGLFLEMPGLVIDGTLKNRLNKIIPYLKSI